MCCFKCHISMICINLINLFLFCHHFIQCISLLGKKVSGTLKKRNVNFFVFSALDLLRFLVFLSFFFFKSRLMVVMQPDWGHILNNLTVTSHPNFLQAMLVKEQMPTANYRQLLCAKHKLFIWKRTRRRNSTVAVCAMLCSELKQRKERKYWKSFPD